MKQKKFDFHIFVMRLAALLLSLVMLTTGMVSGRYARYSSSASGSASARVAKFSVAQTIEFESNTQRTTLPIEKLLPGETVTATVTVDYHMDVAAKSTITATNAYEGVPGNLPLTFLVYEANTTHGTAAAGSYSFTADCPRGNGYEKVYTVEINFPNTGNPQAYNGMVDFVTITVTTEQAD